MLHAGLSLKLRETLAWPLLTFRVRNPELIPPELCLGAGNVEKLQRLAQDSSREQDKEHAHQPEVRPPVGLFTSLSIPLPTPGPVRSLLHCRASAGVDRG